MLTSLSSVGRLQHQMPLRRDRAGAGDQPPLLPADGRRPHRRERLWPGLDVHRAAAGPVHGRGLVEAATCRSGAAVLHRMDARL